MGLFDNMKDNAPISRRQDDGSGTYWQRIDDIKEEKSQAQVPYLKIYKTNIKLISASGDGREIQAGTTPTHAVFPSGKSTYAERDLKLLCKALFNLSREEAEQLRFTRGGLTKDQELANADVLYAKDKETRMRFPGGVDEFKAFLEAPTIGEIVQQRLFAGIVVEARCSVQPKAKKPNETYTRVDYVRSVPVEELAQKLTPAEIATFFPQGLTVEAK
jgi:hypothetical protein